MPDLYTDTPRTFQSREAAHRWLVSHNYRFIGLGKVRPEAERWCSNSGATAAILSNTMNGVRIAFLPASYD